MTSVTDTDIKEIKEAILALDKKLTAQINELEKNITNQMNDLDKHLTSKIIELTGEIKTTNAKIQAMETRLGNQEFLYRTVFAGIVTFIVGAMLKYYFDHPIL